MKDILGYKFTGKELDEETGYYYFGARYYDPKISVWLSTDPALPEYLPTAQQVYFPEEAFDAKKLKGSGGIFNSVNGNPYQYAKRNPLIYIDPDGRVDVVIRVREFDKNAQYGSIAHVFINNNGNYELVGTFLMNMRADDGSRLADGAYWFKTGTHPISGGESTRYYSDNGQSYIALNLYSDPAMTNREIPASETSPKPNGESTYTGLNLHVGNRLYPDNDGDTGSQGCPTVPILLQGIADPKNMETWDNYNKVMEMLKGAETGIITIEGQP